MSKLTCEHSIPFHPAVFFKNRNSYNHPGRDVVIPTQSSLPDYEGELGVVIGPRACKDEDGSDPYSIFGPNGCVLGFTAANDVSARCWQVCSPIIVISASHLLTRIHSIPERHERR